MGILFIFFIFIFCWSVTHSCLTLCNTMYCSSPGFPVLHHCSEFAQTHVHWVSVAIQPTHPLLYPSLPAISLSQHQDLFQWLGFSIRCPKYWNISPANKYSWLIYFRIDWFGLLAVQGTLKSLQHHSSKASILQHSAFLTDQLSHRYTTTGKTIALIIKTFVSKMVCHNSHAKKQLSSNFMTESPSTVILEHNKRKPITASTLNYCSLILS